MVEIATLRKAFEEVNERNEENLLKQMQEFKHLDDVRKRRITKYKEEGEKQIEKFKQVLKLLKDQKHAIKQELEQVKFREVEYIRQIEELNNR